MPRLNDEQKKKVSELLAKGVPPMKIIKDLSLDKYAVYNVRKKLVAGNILKPLRYKRSGHKRSTTTKKSLVSAPKKELSEPKVTTKTETPINFTVNNTSFVVYNAKKIVITPTGVDIQS